MTLIWTNKPSFSVTMGWMSVSQQLDIGLSPLELNSVVTLLIYNGTSRGLHKERYLPN